MKHTRSRLLAAAAGAALTIGAGGLAVAAGSGAFADTQTPSPDKSASANPNQPDQQNGHRHRGMRGQGGHTGLKGGQFGGRMLHGEIVVADDSGSGTTKLLVQEGSVTAVSGKTVTVKSSDGFTVAWTVNDTTRTGWPRRGQDAQQSTGDISQIAVGEDVDVVGTKTGDGTATATALHEEGVRGAKGGSSTDPKGESSTSPNATGSSTLQS